MISSQFVYDVDPIYGCFIWRGKLGNNGRPIVWRGRKPSSAYQLAWEAVNGSVPTDHVLDHLCRRPLCIRPLHLEAVTKSENERRKTFGYVMRRTHCAKGHDLSTAMITPEMGRLCRTCEREAIGASR